MASSDGSSGLGDRLGSETVKLLVGTKRKEVVIHKKLVCESADFFKKAFHGELAEAYRGEMYLPEESPATISIYISWLYRGSLPHLEEFARLDEFIDFYVFAVRLDLYTLQDRIVDAIQDFLASNPEFVPKFLTVERASKVFHNTHVCLGLSEFLVKFAAVEYVRRITRTDCGDPFARQEIAILYLACEGSGHSFAVLVQFSRELAEFITRGSDTDVIASWARNEDHRNRCTFHMHNMRNECHLDETKMRSKDISGCRRGAFE